MNIEAVLVLSMALMLFSAAGGAVAESNVGPKHRAVKVGATVVLYCRAKTPDDVMRWDYYAPLQSTAEVVYNGQDSQRMSPKFGRCKVDRGENHYDLVITNVQATDAGTYVCYGTNDPLRYAVALIVFSRNPVCSLHSVESQRDVFCHVNYTGDWMPSFDCQPRTPSAHIIINNSPSVGVTHRQLDILSSNNSTMECTLYFNRSDLRMILDTKAYSTNTPVYIWKLTPSYLGPVAHASVSMENYATQSAIPKWGVAVIAVVATVFAVLLILLTVHVIRKFKRNSSQGTQSNTQRTSAKENAYAELAIPSTSQASGSQPAYWPLNKLKSATMPARSPKADSYPNDYIELPLTS